MENQTLQRVLNAISFRDAGTLHNNLRQSGSHVHPQTRKLVRDALRAAGLVGNKTS